MKKEWAFHQWSITDLQRHFDVLPKDGLSSKRAYFRYDKYGPNSLNKLKEKSALGILLRQFGSVFILLLAIAAVISYFIDGLAQAFILFIIILANILLGFFQEYKAEKALDELKKTFRSKSKVLRNSKIEIIDNQELVPGDIVLLETGDMVPADIRIIESEGLKANESSLTGESLPVSKVISVMPLDTVLADRKNMLFGSTIISAGKGKGMVVATGENTEFGKIAGLVQDSDEVTPLESKISYLAKIMAVIALTAGGLIFLMGYLRNYELLPLLTFVISLIVSAVPESLPTVITLSLAIGVSRMAKKKAIVRKLAVIEALGATNIIATDKTGTLTNNELIVEQSYTHSRGKLVKTQFANLGDMDIALYKRAALCTAILDGSKNGMIGDPLDIAIVKKAESLHKGLIGIANNPNRVIEIPFDSERKYMAVSLKNGSQNELIVKGITEKILDFCTLNKTEKESIAEQSDFLSKDGYKVIALAYKNVGSHSPSTFNSMTFLGLFAFADEPSFGIKEAIKKVIDCGIRPIIITGDHPETAKYIANRIGLVIDDDEIVTGSELDKMDNKHIKKILPQVKIFARISPTDKINIVKLLQEMGYSVAVTGDGINDAPALKEATVGIAMGIKGTDVARESSDIILSDDKYSTIISAIEYGRSIFDNIRNVVTLLLVGNFDEILLVSAAFLIDLPLPLTTLQILWINLVTESLLCIALVFEEPNAKVLKEKPRTSKTDSLKQPVFYALQLSAISFASGLILFLWQIGESVAKARTMIFTHLVLICLVYVLTIRSDKRFWQKQSNFLRNRYLIFSILLVIGLQSLLFAKPFSEIFEITPLSLPDILVLVGFSIVAFVFAELLKYRQNRNQK